jgi:nucleotide-binding universal stress UspA family protein
MRVLCCLDGTNVEQVSRATEMLSTTPPKTLGLLHVIDTGPRKDIEHTRERFLRRPDPPPLREHQMEEAERTSAQDILDEGLRCFGGAEALQRKGRPEREIVNLAAEWEADLVIVCPRAEHRSKPAIGPKSVGHTARFVIDHAPCPVLLVRPLARNEFPIER